MKRALAGVIGVVVAGVGVFAYVESSARAELKARAGALEEAIQACTSRPTRRPCLFEDGRDEDARAHYQAFEAAYADLGGLEPEVEEVLALEGVDPAAEREFARWSPAIAAIDSAVRSLHCDWDLPMEQGFELGGVKLYPYRELAALLAYRGRTCADPAEALRCARTLLAVGGDLEEVPSLTVNHMGVALEQYGLWVLEVRLQREALTAAQYEALERLLEPPSRLNVTVSLQWEWLLVASELLRWSGQEVLGEGKRAGDPRMWWTASGALRTYTACARYYAQLPGIADLPRAERAAAKDALWEEAEGWDSVTGQVLIYPGVYGLEDTVRARRRALRAIVAAQAHRLEHGVFPDTLEELGEQEFPFTDPFADGALLQWRREGDAVACWSVFQNLVDDGGEGSTEEGSDPSWSGIGSDLVVRSKVPGR